MLATMKINVPAALLVLALGLLPAAALQETADITPVAPLPVSTHRGFTNAIVLENDIVRVVVVPEIGRIVSLRLPGRPSLLREDAAQDRGLSTDTNIWANYGGLWLWPAAQARWKESFGTDWPPPRPLDDVRWTGSAWRRADGGQVCRLRAEIGTPCNGRITRDIVLLRNSGLVDIAQRVERVGPGQLPLSLWNLAQIAGPDEVILPEDAGKPIRTLGFAPVEDRLLTRCDGTVSIRVGEGTEHKVGSASPRSWIAARRDGQILLMQASPGDRPGPYPDGDSRVTVYANKGLGYAEIETLSEELPLLPGQVLTNRVTLQAFQLVTPLRGCELARWLRERVGELEAPAAPAGAEPSGF